MKSRLSFGKTASSALLFATLSCITANFSPAHAAQENTTAAALSESSTQEPPTPVDVSRRTQTAEPTESFPAANQQTQAVLTNPEMESEIATSSADTLVEPTPTTANELAVAAPTDSPTLPEIPLAELETGTESTEALSETPVQELQRSRQAQSLPVDDTSDSVSPDVMPLEDSLEAEGDENEPMDQVTNVTQLSDVRPNDWAYEALRSLVERYGCIAGYPDGTFRGNRAMTRYEFAAGLNSCLQQIERLIAGGGSNLASRQDLETLRRLVNEFQTELTAIGSRVDQLEGRTARLEENQFSTTTKLFGQAIFGIQGRTENEFDFFNFRKDTGNPLEDGGTEINLVDNVQLSLFTQLSPRTLLLTGLSAGNGGIFGVPSLPNYVSLAYQSGIDNDVQLSDLNFRHLIGRNLAVIAGPVGVNPVNVFRGVNRVESAGQGPLSLFAQRNPIINIGGGGRIGSGGGAGIGFDLQVATRVSFQAVYSVNGAEDPFNGGLFGGENGSTTAGAQLVVSPTNNIDLSLQYINSYSPFGILGTGVGDDQVALEGPSGRAPIQTNAFGASLEWRLTPRFTIGGWGGYTTSDLRGGEGSVETINWMGFINVLDLLGEGNLLGIYVGQPPRITDSDISEPSDILAGSPSTGRNVPSFVNRADLAAGEGGQPDTTLHLEAFYRIRVTDNISLTPGVVVILNPNQNDNNDTITIGALRTTFTF